MLKQLRGTSASVHLDMIRGLAAIVVVLNHLTFWFFQSYQDLAAPTLSTTVLYGICSRGHEAVIIFFVLSGYFVGGSVMQDCQSRGWSWGRYLTNRVTRLYIVLLPALLLTVFWDRLGMHFYGDSVVYTGGRVVGGEQFDSVLGRSGVGTFLGNALFLQQIKVEPFGSNEALWSLSYEFWYYLLFPCLYVGVFASRSWLKTGVYVLASLAVFLFVGRSISLYFSIWLLGALLARLPRLSILSRRGPWWAALILTSTLWLTLVAAAHSVAFKALLWNKIGAVDLLIGISFTLLIFVLLHCTETAKAGPYKRAAEGLGGFSYSLYALHLPLLVFLRAAIIADSPWTPSLEHVAAAAAIGVLAIFYAWCISLVTEARLPYIRRLIRFPRAAIEAHGASELDRPPLRFPAPLE